MYRFIFAQTTYEQPCLLAGLDSLHLYQAIGWLESISCFAAIHLFIEQMLTQHLLRARGFLRLEALQWTQALSLNPIPVLLPWEWFSSEPSSSQLQNAGKYNLPKRWLWKLAMLARVQWWDPGGVLGALSKCWCLNPAPLQAWAAPALSTPLDLASGGETQPSTHVPGCLDSSPSTGKNRG